MTVQSAGDGPQTTLANWVYTPDEVAEASIAAIERQAKNADEPPIGIFMPDIQDYFAPMLPGQICGIIAQTSNYKSGLMHHLKHLQAEKLAEHKSDKVLIHISVEEGIEEQAFLMFARESGESPDHIARGIVQNWEKLYEAAEVVNGIPIYRIGGILARPDNMPELYLSNMMKALDVLVKGRVVDQLIRIGAIYVDYLQAFPIDPEIKRANHDAQRRSQARSDVFRLKRMAAKYRCPVFVKIQTRQHLTGAPNGSLPLPGIYDGEEASFIAQRFDRLIGCFMLRMTLEPQGKYKVGGKSYDMREEDLWIKVLKQRGGLPGGRMYYCRVDFTKNTVAPYDKRESQKLQEMVENSPLPLPPSGLPKFAD
jgi:hypothetical protein